MQPQAETPRDRLLFMLLVFLLALALWLPFFISSAGQLKRAYHPYAISVLASEDPANWHGKFLTHIEVQGFVTYVAKEGDGDIHIRLCDSADLKAMDTKHCVVAEVIPTLKPKGFLQPKVGMHLKVRGIGRYDAENPGHHWWECHPVEEMAVM